MASMNLRIFGKSSENPKCLFLLSSFNVNGTNDFRRVPRPFHPQSKAESPVLRNPMPLAVLMR